MKRSAESYATLQQRVHASLKALDVQLARAHEALAAGNTKETRWNAGAMRHECEYIMRILDEHPEGNRE